MCKVLALTNTKKIDLKKINDIGNMLMSFERDGFGYAIQGKSGVFGEKCVAKEFKSRLNVKNPLNLPFLKEEYSRFGEVSAPSGPGIFHGRTSTNSKGIKNCHPMIRSNNYLIHNGVVTDHGADYEKFTDNDSEDVLYRFLEGIPSVEKNLSGYYAFANIDDLGLLHIVRDSQATLHMGWSEKLDSYIIATTPEVLKKAAKILGTKVEVIDAIKDDVYVVFKGNDILSYKDIKPRGRGYAEARWAGYSLGREIDDDSVGNIASAATTSCKLPTEGSEKDSIIDALKPSGKSKSKPSPLYLSAGIVDATKSSIDPYDTDEYLAWREEIDNMDPSYQIYEESGAEISLVEFRKLDPIAQELCDIIRPDGTMLLIDDIFRKAE